MNPRNAIRAVAASAAPPVDIPAAARARCCPSCNNVATCAIARYTHGEVEICSRWEERKTAA